MNLPVLKRMSLPVLIGLATCYLEPASHPVVKMGRYNRHNGFSFGLMDYALDVATGIYRLGK
jgi:hypothetical protein